MVRVFLPPTSNEARLIDQIDAHINKVVELGFLRQAEGQPSRSTRSAASSRPSSTASGSPTSTSSWPSTAHCGW